MCNKIYSYIILFFLTLFGVLKTDILYAQQTFSLSGYISDKASGETLNGASIRVSGQVETGTVSNDYGYYTLKLPSGNYEIVVSYLGYEEKKDTINLHQSLHKNFHLLERAVRRQEILIKDTRKDENVTDAEMGKVKLSMKEIEKMPAIFGETDILKTLQMLPGVKSGGEGTTDLFIRGGGPGQNLVLLDDAPVYNTGHLFGFFSVFNGDAIKDVTLIKGGMPANYGGRLSSVVDVKMKDGNDKEFHGKGGVGLVASRLSLEGPIVKDKSSFFVSARRTYIDALIRPFVSGSSPFKGSGYYFYDLNMKVNYKLSDKDRLFLSGYLGQDRFKFASSDKGFKMEMPWGNKTATLRWNHLFSDRLFSNIELIYNDYNFKMDGAQKDFLMRLHSGIKDFTFKTNFSYYLNNQHHIQFGGLFTHHKFIPSTVSGSSNKIDFDADNPFTKYGREIAFYVMDKWKISKRLKVNAGMRWSLFQQIGAYTDYHKNENGDIIDSTVFSSGQPVATYSGWEPRFILQYSLKHHNSIKASITHNAQYIHLVNSNSTTLPTDLWVPSTALVQPEKAWQYSLGYFQNFRENTYETSLAVYYKRMKNEIEFSSSYVPSSLGEPQSHFVFGNAKAYGAELFIRKQKGRLKGWIGYTLSWVYRKFPDLNNGERYPARQDRRHDLKVVAAYTLNKRWTFAANFILQSGNPITLPERFYVMEGALSQAYGKLNSYRLPTYHRLDLSATYKPKPKPDRSFSHYWVFSLYNAYSRLNPFFIYFDVSGDYVDKTLKVQPKKVALFPVIPSVSWNFEF